MKRIKTKLLRGFIVLGAFLLLLPSIGLGQVDCPGSSLQTAINASSPGATISITGTCNENITIPWDKTSLTLNGGGTATINALNSTLATVTVLARNASVRGLNIQGGLDGVRVVRGAVATIDGNTIQSGMYGIVVAQASFAAIINNTIENNPSGGIVVSDNASAYVGINSPSDTVAQPNDIQSNAIGIIVSGSSSARIVGNNISNNTGNGVQVVKASQADIASNTIDGNGQNGILVTQNSGVNLGRDTGTTIFDLPNSTTINNGDKGLRCNIQGYADGRLGTLNGTGPNPTFFFRNCSNSLIPFSVGVSGAPYAVGWGGDASDVPVTGDFDRDGKTDIAVYRTSTGAWYIIPSRGDATYGLGWGGDLSDKPIPGDYDGDGITDLAVYRTGTGAWYIIPSAPGP
jgi:parallel beta-helix repeat protein